MLTVTLTYAPKPRTVQHLQLTVPDGTRVRELLTRVTTSPDSAEWHAPVSAALTGQLKLAIWHRRAKLDEAVRDGDHVSLCRGLIVDPMVARRTRFQSQGARTAGLFSKRRPGAKSGY